MIDLTDQLARLLDNEPEAPYDIDHIVRSGRRARRRLNVALAAAGTVGAAGLTAAVLVPVVAAGGNEGSVSLGVQPSPSPSPSARTGKCYLISSPPKAAKHDVARLIKSGRVGKRPSVTTVKSGRTGDRTVAEVCSQGTSPTDSRQDKQQNAQAPAGPPYDYTEAPEAIASRLGAHLHDRVTGFGLSITFTRPFSQESSNLEGGRPSYFGGNVDVHEPNGYGDIGVQVMHAVAELVPFTGDCTAAQQCTETKLPDGSVLRTGQVKAGQGDVVLTAELHRPDGVVVQAQESNYPFGPDAGSQPHGDQPLSLDQLVTLAEDVAFTF
ncbi:MAG: hypothetical protein QOJ03_2171 [Frankiaceae bacterium]|jgi:hypothetical protein|nr:hypothetical protein [Frankiaceae bacterium]